MTSAAKLALLAGFLLLGGLWLWHDRRTTRQLAVLETSRDSLTNALHASETRQRERDRQDTALTRTVVLVHLQVDTVVIRAAVAESVFVERLPDSLIGPFRAVIATKDDIITGLNVIVGVQAQQLSLRAVSLGECREGLVQALLQRDRALKLARPPFAIRLFRDLPKYGLGAGIALVVVTLAP